MSLTKPNAAPAATDRLVSEMNGSALCSLCYEDPREVSPEDFKHRRIGKLIYFRSGDANVRLDIIPSAAWAAGIEYFIGNFTPSEKVPEPPFIDGDLIAQTEDRKDPVFVGHIKTRERDSDGAVQYYMELRAIPIYQWKKLIESDKEHKSLYLKVRL